MKALKVITVLILVISLVGVYCLGNYISLDNYYTTTPADGGEKVVEEEEEGPNGVPEGIYYLNAYDGYLGFLEMKGEISARYDDVKIFLCAQGEWDENTVLELRETCPDSKIVIVECKVPCL